MATLKYFLETSDGVLIETDEGGSSPNAYVTDFAKALRVIARAAVAKPEGEDTGGDDMRPGIKIEFGLKALSRGGFVISLDETAANFRIILDMPGQSPAPRASEAPPGI